MFALSLSAVRRGHDNIVDCVLVRAGCLVAIANYGGRMCILIHTLDRYWKIVYPIHHRKYYRRWMSYFGMILPRLLGTVVELPLAVATTRVVNVKCRERAFWSSETAHMVCYCCLTQIDLILRCPLFPLYLFGV